MNHESNRSTITISLIESEQNIIIENSFPGVFCCTSFPSFRMLAVFCCQELSDDNMAAALRAAQEKMDGKAQRENSGAIGNGKGSYCYVDECREIF